MCASGHLAVHGIHGGQLCSVHIGSDHCHVRHFGLCPRIGFRLLLTLDEVEIGVQKSFSANGRGLVEIIVPGDYHFQRVVPRVRGPRGYSLGVEKEGVGFGLVLGAFLWEVCWGGASGLSFWGVSMPRAKGLFNGLVSNL